MFYLAEIARDGRASLTVATPMSEAIARRTAAYGARMEGNHPGLPGWGPRQGTRYRALSEVEARAAGLIAGAAR